MPGAASAGKGGANEKLLYGLARAQGASPSYRATSEGAWMTWLRLAGRWPGMRRSAALTRIAVRIATDERRHRGASEP